jgi:predicted type IV restriction endonuclease
MILHSNVSLDQGHRNLQRIIKEIGDKHVDWNEADTRFHIIDRVLVECLGWSKDQERFKIESRANGEFRDYVLGSPELVIWEAKRSGAYFDFPADTGKRAFQSIQSIFAVSKTAESAMRQAQSYCNESGIEFAVVCNGHQLIGFAAIRVGQSWIKGHALAIRNLQHLDENFPLVWQCLSPGGMFERRLYSLLITGSAPSVPRKLSTRLRHFPEFRYPTDLQNSLRSLSELLLEDIISTEAVRAQFYRECYCDTGALSRDSLVSEEILQARYAALFAASEPAPLLEPAAKQGSDPALSKQILTEALARRPIVLLGDVGVGKTAFLEQLMYVRAPQEFARAINIYIDLGSKAALEIDIRKFVIGEIERQLLDKYGVDLQQDNFVRGVYDSEIKRFRGSFKAAIYKANKAKHDEELMTRLDGLMNDKAEHLRRSLQHVARARLRQTIIILDNADQRAAEVQEAAFIIAQEFAQNWEALVFIAVRPQTFFQSKRAGALSAYPHKVFTILPPRPELVVEKRLIFAVKIAEGKVAADVLSGVRLNLNSVATFLRVLRHSLERNRDLAEILANITAGNIKAVLEFVRRFIGNPNVEAEKIVNIQETKGIYTIPLHEFSKAAILGDYSHFFAESSLAMNIYDVEHADRKEHFLCLMIITFLLSGSTPRDRNEFVHTALIREDMQRWGFLPAQTDKAFRRMTNKRLIETTERITFEEDLVGLTGDIPDGFRATSIGAYHVRRWAADFAYLDAMVVDTPIFDASAQDAIAENLESFDISDRFARTLTFRNYLSAIWDASGLRPTYFDWHEAVKYGQGNFDSVRRAIERNAAGTEAGPRGRWRRGS